MKLTKERKILLEALITLQLINYMVGTIILKDFFLFKYLRDAIVVVLLFEIARDRRKKMQFGTITTCFLVFVFCELFGMIQGESLRIVLLVTRRYAIPLAVLFIVSQIDFNGEERGFLVYILYLIVALSIFGVFQAQVLGDGFLRKLGYPVEYSHGYGRDMLYNSFYFGGLGIQRVVATLSSSNICALALGASLLYFLVWNPIFNVKYEAIMIICIAVAFLLTFSRSNILLFVIAAILIWKYIPYKKYILAGIGCAALIILILGIIQGQDGIIYKLWMWVQSTLNMTEDSAAGRSGIWQTALTQVLKSPLGIGFGHVGAIGYDSELVFLAENSYLTIALDTGWIGVVSYVAALVMIVLKLYSNAVMYGKAGNEKGKRICVAGYAVLIYLMGVMLFSNHIQDMEVVTLVYMYVGIGLSYVRYNGGINEKIDKSFIIRKICKRGNN